MIFDYDLLEALSAVSMEGSFDKAATALSLTPSAISQRIKLLETRLGAILVVRGKPCELTELGNVVIRHLEKVRLLEREFLNIFPTGTINNVDQKLSLRIAVNADSIATWFPLVMAGLSKDKGVRLDLLQDDQEFTIDRLKEGHVLAAVTADPRTLQGFQHVELGSLEYVAVASPEFIETHFSGGVTIDTLNAAPALVFNRKDTLLNQWANQIFQRDLVGNTHWVPSYEGYIKCCVEGVGWGLHPLMSTEPFMKEGRLVELMPSARVKIPLFWQYGKASGTVMRELTTLVEGVAAQWLTQEQAPEPV